MLTNLPTLSDVNGERVLTYTLVSYDANSYIKSHSIIIIPISTEENLNLVKGFPHKVKFGAINTNTVVPKGHPQNIANFLDREDKAPQNFIFTIEFEYESVERVNQKPLRKAYQVYENKRVYLVTDEFFDSITARFIRDKLWKNN